MRRGPFHRSQEVENRSPSPNVWSAQGNAMVGARRAERSRGRSKRGITGAEPRAGIGSRSRVQNAKERVQMASYRENDRSGPLDRSRFVNLTRIWLTSVSSARIGSTLHRTALDTWTQFVGWKWRRDEICGLLILAHREDA